MRRLTVMLVAAVAVSGCVGGATTEPPVTTRAAIPAEAPDTTTTSDLTTTTSAITPTGVPESTTTTNAPIVGGVTTRHDSACTYEGPTEFDLNSDVTFTFINASEIFDVGFSVWKVDEGTTIEDIFENGIFEVADEEQDFYHPYLPTPRAKGIEWSLTVTLDKVGLHALNCFQLPEDPDSDEVFPDYASTLFTVRG